MLRPKKEGWLYFVERWCRGNAAAGVAHARITQPTTREANREGFALVRVREAWAVGVWGCGGVRGFAAAARSGRGLWLGLFRGDRNTAESSRIRLLRPVFVQRATPHKRNAMYIALT